MINNDYSLNAVAASGPTKGNYSRIDWRKETEHVVRLLPNQPIETTFLVYSRHWIDGRPIVAPCMDDPLTMVGRAARALADKWGETDPRYKVFTGYPHKTGVANLCRVETMVMYNAIMRPALPADEPQQGYVTLKWKQHSKLWDMLKKKAGRKAQVGETWSMFDPEAGCDLIVGYYPDSKSGSEVWSLEFDETSPIGIEDWQEKMIDLQEEHDRMQSWSVEELAAYAINKFDILFSEHTDTTVEQILQEAGYDV